MDIPVANSNEKILELNSSRSKKSFDKIAKYIDAAKEESVNTILEMADFKTTGKCQALVVSGCLAQRYSTNLEKEIPEIDLIIGTGQYQRVVELLESRQKALELGSPLPSRIYVDQPAFIHTENDPRMKTGLRHSAFLKLSEGCNRRCAFCIIPHLRGDMKSRSIEDIVEEAKKLAIPTISLSSVENYSKDIFYINPINYKSSNIAQALDFILKYAYISSYTAKLLRFSKNKL